MSRFSLADCITNTPKVSIDIGTGGNVIVGHNSCNVITDEYKDCTIIGNNVLCSGNSQVQLGSSNTNVYTTGGVQNMSDQRDKTAIRDTVLGLSFIKQLRPVDYKWNCRRDYIVASTQATTTVNGVTVPVLEELPNDGSKTRTRYHHGLIAQEVKQVMDALNVDFGGYQDHSIKGGKDQLSIAYMELIGPLIKSIQELNAKVELLEQQLANKI